LCGPAKPLAVPNTRRVAAIASLAVRLSNMVAVSCFVWPDKITGEERALIEARSVQAAGSGAGRASLRCGSGALAAVALISPLRNDASVETPPVAVAAARLQRLSPVAEAVGERRHVTVMFCERPSS